MGRAGFFTSFCNSLEMFCLVAESEEVLMVHLPRDIDPGSGISLLTKGNGFQTPKTGQESGLTLTAPRLNSVLGFICLLPSLAFHFAKQKWEDIECEDTLCCVSTGLTLHVPKKRGEQSGSAENLPLVFPLPELPVLWRKGSVQDCGAALASLGSPQTCLQAEKS